MKNEYLSHKVGWMMFQTLWMSVVCTVLAVASYWHEGLPPCNAMHHCGLFGDSLSWLKDLPKDK